MKNDKTWKLICACLVASLFYIGHGLHSQKQPSSNPFFESAANASTNFGPTDGVGVANENSETIFTCSQDGKTLYRWQYFSSKNAKYLGKSDAVESQGTNKR